MRLVSTLSCPRIWATRSRLTPASTKFLPFAGQSEDKSLYMAGLCGESHQVVLPVPPRRGGYPPLAGAII